MFDYLISYSFCTKPVKKSGGFPSRVSTGTGSFTTNFNTKVNLSHYNDLVELARKELLEKEGITDVNITLLGVSYLGKTSDDTVTITLTKNEAEFIKTTYKYMLGMFESVPHLYDQDYLNEVEAAKLIIKRLEGM